MTYLSTNISRLQQLIKQALFLGHDPSAELIAILMVYLVQGILGLARLAVSFFLKDEMALSPTQVSAMLGIAALPWVVKPLFGFISDGLPIAGYKRRPYLILSGVLGMAAWVAMAVLVQTPTQALIAMALGSLAVAVSDVIVDSLVVERVRTESISASGTLQSLCWGSTAVGGILTAYFSGSLLEQYSSRGVFAITAIFPMIVAFSAIFIDESPVMESSSWQQIRNQLNQLWGAVRLRSIWLPTSFVFIWQATPNAESAFFFFTTNELGFQPEFLGRLRLVTSLASLIGVWAFQRWFKVVPFRVIFIWTTIVSAGLGMSMLLLVTHLNRSMGISDEWFSIGDNLVLTVMGQIAYMPVLVLAARLCPPGVEASLFALLMSICNLASLLSYEWGALITHWLGITESNFNNLWILVLITNLSTLLPLPVIHWLPIGEPHSMDDR
ncbi:MAG: folate/biopterin family MFS transporter [Synechococcales cyanobacterium]